MTGARVVYRRSPTLVLWWNDNRLMGHDYGLDVEREVPTSAVAVLTHLSSWTSVADLRLRVSRLSVAAIRRWLVLLTKWGFVETSDTPANEMRSEIEGAWSPWMPSAAHFHFATKDRRRVGLEEATEEIESRLFLEPYPETVKRDDRARRVALTPFRRQGAFPKILLTRRSWRRFGKGRVTLDQVSNLLGLTWAVQHWMRIRPEIRSALKTSPSGGACHGIEVYVVARHVEGLAAGIYHYCPDTHDLELVRNGLPRRPIEKYLGGQPWFADCGAMFVMTSVVERVMWKYPFPRAYRWMLMEAGHFAQTFCLVATWLRLAPFCTAAFADSVIERALRIDGVNEAALYVTGVGTQPNKATWAPWPSPADTPTMEPPAHVARRRGRSQGV